MLNGRRHLISKSKSLVEDRQQSVRNEEEISKLLPCEGWRRVSFTQFLERVEKANAYTIFPQKKIKNEVEIIVLFPHAASSKNVTAGVRTTNKKHYDMIYHGNLCDFSDYRKCHPSIRI